MYCDICYNKQSLGKVGLGDEQEQIKLPDFEDGGISFLRNVLNDRSKRRPEDFELHQNRYENFTSRKCFLLQGQGS